MFTNACPMRVRAKHFGFACNRMVIIKIHFFPASNIVRLVEMCLLLIYLTEQSNHGLYYWNIKGLKSTLSL